MPRLRMLALAALVAYAALFALLGVDTMIRVWSVRSTFDTTFDGGVLLLYEGMRVITIAAGAALAAATAVRGRRSPHTAPVVLLLVMLLVAYAKATAFGGFPGFVQERVARALLGRGWSPELLTFVFGEPAWAFIMAAAAFLRLAVTYPVAATPATVLAMGHLDRAGMLRSVAFAGTDVGALTRHACAWALDRGAFRPLALSIAAGVAIAAQHFAGRTISLPIVAASLAVPLALGVPALRAGLAASDAGQRARLLWFFEAGLVAGLALVVGGILSIVPGGVLGWVSFALLAIAPAIVLLCIATALAPAGGVEPEKALHVTAHWGATAVLVLAALVAIDSMIIGTLDAEPALRALVAVIAAACLGTPVHTMLRGAASKLLPRPFSAIPTDR